MLHAEMMIFVPLMRCLGNFSGWSDARAFIGVEANMTGSLPLFSHSEVGGCSTK
jgi:hypothetical protein